MGTVIAAAIGIVFGGILNMVVAVWAEHRRQAVLVLEAQEPDDAHFF
jgi:hypothetical protein